MSMGASMHLREDADGDKFSATVRDSIQGKFYLNLDQGVNSVAVFGSRDQLLSIAKSINDKLVDRGQPT